MRYVGCEPGFSRASLGALRSALGRQLGRAATDAEFADRLALRKADYFRQEALNKAWQVRKFPSRQPQHLVQMRADLDRTLGRSASDGEFGALLYERRQELAGRGAEVVREVGSRTTRQRRGRSLRSASRIIMTSARALRVHIRPKLNGLDVSEALRAYISGCSSGMSAIIAAFTVAFRQMARIMCRLCLGLMKWT